MRKGAFPRVRVSLPFVCLMAVLYALDFGKVFLPTLFAVFIHEISHILATRICGGRIDFVDIRIFGIRVNVPELRLMSYKREIIIAAAGPLAGIVTAICASATARFFGIEALSYFVGINLVISAINLIPVYPLDGGRIVLSTALSFLSLRSAHVISIILATTSITGLFALCAHLAFCGKLNPSLVVFSLYIVACGVRFRPRL